MATLQLLATELSRARAEGQPFTQAWNRAVQLTLNAACDAADWGEALEATADTWRRAYEHGPTTRAEVACGMLVHREPGIDLTAHCAYRLSELPAAKTRGPKRLYCTDRCRRRATYDRVAA